MFKYIALLALAPVAVEAGIGLCEEQAPCLSYSVTKVDAGCDGDCEYKICFFRDSKEGCTKGDNESISHIGLPAGVEENGNFCPSTTTGEWETTGCPSKWGMNDLQCQNVKPGGKAFFLSKDGSGCGTGGATIGESDYGTTATCAASNDCAGEGDDCTQTFFPRGNGKKGTCSGNQEGVECVWTVTAPLECEPQTNNPPPPPPPVDPPTVEDPPVDPPTEEDPPVDPPTEEDPPVELEDPTSPPAGSNGDPHFKTWKNEHFEYHGQCDLVLTKDESFANDIGLEVQIRTKVVRFWSYIKNAAIRIGEDILEVEGGAETESTNHYWYNLAYQGKIETLGGFPVTYHQPVAYKRRFEVDLSSKFPGQKIIISTYKEFVRVDFENGTEEAFGNTKGLLGDFKSGATLARDGSTVLNDFWEYGNEWQVLPFENMLFHETSEPQFPQKCIQPEDPRGDRRRKLAESTVSEAQAEAACAHLKDPLDRKDCVYDILATQDLDMVGAY